ncbi:MAG: ribokinase [Paracoccaceae bacterium]
MTGSVFVVGALHLDVVVTAPHLPRRDETVVGHSVAYLVGGKGANQAMAAAKMGASVAMAGCVGEDSFGARLLAGLDAGKVDRTQVRQVAGASGMSVAIVEAGGEYGAVIVSGVNQEINPSKIVIPASASVLLLQNEIPEAVNLAIAEKSKASGLTVILNAAPARSVAPDLLAMIDILILNRVETADLLAQDEPNLDPVKAALELADHVPSVILTLGADGLLLAERETVREAPAHRVQAVSAHGAGDALIGALAARLANGDTLFEAVGFAQAAAALHVASPVSERETIKPETVESFRKGQAANR